jgi:hypothetical protein
MYIRNCDSLMVQTHNLHFDLQDYDIATPRFAARGTFALRLRASFAFWHAIAARIVHTSQRMSLAAWPGL